MASESTWLEQQKELLTRSLERVRNDVTKNLEAELKRREELHKAELLKRDERERVISSRYEDEIVRNSHLVDENSELKHHIEKLERKATPKPNVHHAHALEPPATVSIEEYQRIAQQFEELHQKHQETLQRMKYVEKKNAAVMQKNKDMKESVLAWQRYADRHLPKHGVKGQTKTPEPTRAKVEQERPVMPSSPGSTSTVTPGPSTARAGLSPGLYARGASVGLLTTAYLDACENEGLLRRAIENSGYGTLDQDSHQYPQDLPNERGEETHSREDAEMPDDDDDSRITDEEAGHEAADSSVNIEAGACVNDRVTSSQTTADEATQVARRMLPPTKRPQHDDDEPTVVSERSLKRKRPEPKRAYQANQVRSDGTPSKPFRIKEEPRSSPPPQLTPHLLRKETLDLDELGPNAISTPRHRRVENHKIGTLHHQCSSSVPLIKEEVVERRTHDASLVPANASPSIHNANDAHLMSPDMSSSGARANSEPTTQRRQPSHALAEIDPNARRGGHIDDCTPSKRQRIEEIRHQKKYAMLTESGEDAPPLDTTHNRLTPNKAREIFNKRIKAGKTTRTPAKPVKREPQSPTTAPSKLSGRTAARNTLAQFETPPANSRRPFALSLGPNARATAQTEPRMLQPTPKPQPQTGPEAPLRRRPAADLKLSDFKPNPAYNQGYSYAFRETVRKRADRACLTGCVRPECCGSTFRAAAAALPPLDSEAEDSLLQDFLGDAYEEMNLTQMSKEEKAELVLQARTRELANKHGKHRHAYERPKSPPGYWRVDFPTTQEQEEDRRRAVEQEREVIRERRAEALRKGGAWVFRDE